MDVLLIYRKTKDQFFSIERVFDSISDSFQTHINIRKVYAIANSSFLEVLQNLNYFRRFHADVYHLTGEINYVILLFPSSKSILTIHDCNFLNHPVKWKRRLIELFWFKLPVKHARFVTVISEQTKNEVIKLSKCPSEKVILIPNPIDPAFIFSPHEFNSNIPVLLHIGTRWNKNLQRVISAVKGLNCFLRIIGRLSDEQKSLLSDTSIEYDNYFDIDKTTLIEFYKAADIIIFPSLSEGFGLPIIEAQSIGRIVVTSNISPMKEVAGDAAIIVDPYDIQSIRIGINLAINDESGREALIEKGKQNVRNYNIKIVAAQYEKLYGEIFNK